MKKFLFFTLMLVVIANHNFAQEVKDSLKNDSIMFHLPKDAFSGYASKFNASDFNKVVAISPLQYIQSRVPGFVVNNLNGNDPNPNLQVQCRGTSTLLLSQDPLYIIDGIPMENADIVTPENIESIEVLKSLADVAPYGIQGANGVVIIKTRKSTATVKKITYSAYSYAETFVQKSDYLSASEYRNLKQNWESSGDSYLAGLSHDMWDYNGSTDWRKEISQHKLSQAHHLEYSGGNKKTTYIAMLNYDRYNGILQKTGNTVINGQASVSHLALKDKLKLNLSLTGTNRRYSQINGNPYIEENYSPSNSLKSTIISVANLYNPTVSVFNPDRSYAIDTLLFPNPNFNPVNLIHVITDDRRINNMLLHLQADYEIVQGLNVCTSYSVHSTNTNNSFSNNYTYRDIDFTNGRSITNDMKERIYTANLQYTRTLNDHHFDLKIVYSNQRNKNSFEYRDSSFTSYNSGSRSRFKANADYDYIIQRISASFTYNYKNTYFLSTNLLREQSALNSYDLKPDYFPGIKAAWLVSNEKFLKNITWLNECNIRGSYGISKRPFQSGYFPDALGKSPLSSSAQHNEKMLETNFGLDVSMFSNRLFVTVENYRRITKNGIDRLLIPVNPFPNEVFNNVEIQNNGWEFSIKSIPVIKPIKWTVGFTFSLNENKVLTNAYLSSGRNIKNQPIGNFYGYQFAGYTSANEIMMTDANGNPSLNYFDSKILGNGCPKSFMGMTHDFEYKNFNLSVLMTGAFGFKVKDLTLATNFWDNNYNKGSLVGDIRNFKNNWIPYTDVVIKNGNYVKIENITLGYTIPLYNQIIKSAKVYIGCNNVALFTGFKGGDPETAGINGLDPGVYYGERYYNSRLFIFGLKVTL
jgi:TonB-linked outer membrane protein, SusC/RagA family